MMMTATPVIDAMEGDGHAQCPKCRRTFHQPDELVTIRPL
jgi:hypothetical protein